ncbi:hypothetical protein GSI_14428 [Ganoderma sinense ZZ0214-1]|uniref:Uncharacterized protein n=1 Tax=Ganoderma sinense ZZ0214-1 TaxID=1077348 RepID=A0A2G8RNN2_9APHY|nr:hypothetical protein GSI_14428 [Ganoderma sinense ZZ0214-1]
MASHSSSGSAATSTSAPSDTASSMDGNGTGNPGMPGLGSSSSLPFSFLVTFVAIFLFFLGCGLGSRRVTRTLRRNLALEVTGLGGDSDRRVARIPRKRPLLWDAFPHEAPSSTSSPLGRAGDGDSVRVFSHPWDVLAPLSATYVRTSPPAAPAPPLRPPGPQTETMSRWHLGGGGFVPSRGLMRAIPRLPPPPTPRAPPNASGSGSRTGTGAAASAAPSRAAPEMHWRGRRVPDWIARPLMPDSLDGPRFNDPDARAEGPGPDEAAEVCEREVQALQVVFLVSLPSPERARAARVRAKALEADRRESGGSGMFGGEDDSEASAGTTIGEYLLGTARVPWRDGEISGTG